uniref:Uncharacterized protein n=1 Tax=Nelumbo nucifera TaxID=4432 RepID=A0A822XSB9_NELNU|nr:TPA_asm: hypothetical protein HUJ06_023442 [Nelumbo nucifera]
MASKKKASKGIALLSMYNDGDEDMEDLNEEEEGEDVENKEDTVVSAFAPEAAATPQYEASLPNDNSTPQSDRAATWTPQQPQTSLPPSPLQQVPPPQHANLSDGQGMKKGSLAIVDYAQDKTTMSPEAEVFGSSIFITTDSF